MMKLLRALVPVRGRVMSQELPGRPTLAPQPLTAGLRAGPSKEGLGQGEAASAAPPTTVMNHSIETMKVQL